MFGRFMYFCFLLALLTSVGTFMALQIAPQFEMIYAVSYFLPLFRLIQSLT